MKTILYDASGKELLTRIDDDRASDAFVMGGKLPEPMRFVVEPSFDIVDARGRVVRSENAQWYGRTEPAPSPELERLRGPGITQVRALRAIEQDAFEAKKRETLRRLQSAEPETETLEDMVEKDIRLYLDGLRSRPVM